MSDDPKMSVQDEPSFDAVVDAMLTDGSGFIHTLALALHAADPVNRAKLVACFPEYWATYTARARHMR